MKALQSTGNALRLTRRDMRVTTNGQWLARRTTPPNGASEFTRAILDRYAGRSVRWPGLGLVFRQGQPALVGRPVYHRTQLHLAPRLALTVLAWPGQPPADVRLAGASLNDQPGPGLRLARQPGEGTDTPVGAPLSAWPGPPLRLKRQLETILVTPAASRPEPVLKPAHQRINRVVRQSGIELRHGSGRVGIALTKQLLHRLVRRGERIEPAAARRRAVPQPGVGYDAVPRIGGAGPVYAPPMQPTPKLTRRAPVIVPETTGLRSDSHQPTFQNGLQTPPDLAPAVVSRLTDQVVRAIDQRIIAHRERMGRI